MYRASAHACIHVTAPQQSLKASHDARCVRRCCSVPCKTCIQHPRRPCHPLLYLRVPCSNALSHHASHCTLAILSFPSPPPAMMHAHARATRSTDQQAAPAVPTAPPAIPTAEDDAPGVKTRQRSSGAPATEVVVSQGSKGARQQGRTSKRAKVRAGPFTCPTLH